MRENQFLRDRRLRQFQPTTHFQTRHVFAMVNERVMTAIRIPRRHSSKYLQFPMDHSCLQNGYYILKTMSNRRRARIYTITMTRKILGFHPDFSTSFQKRTFPFFFFVSFSFEIPLSIFAIYIFQICICTYIYIIYMCT